MVGGLAVAGAQRAKGTVQCRTARHPGIISLANQGLRRVGGFGDGVHRLLKLEKSWGREVGRMGVAIS